MHAALIILRMIFKYSKVLQNNIFTSVLFITVDNNAINVVIINWDQWL